MRLAKRLWVAKAGALSGEKGQDSGAITIDDWGRSMRLVSVPVYRLHATGVIVFLGDEKTPKVDALERKSRREPLCDVNSLRSHGLFVPEPIDQVQRNVPRYLQGTVVRRYVPCKIERGVHSSPFTPNKPMLGKEGALNYNATADGLRILYRYLSRGNHRGRYVALHYQVGTYLVSTRSAYPGF